MLPYLGLLWLIVLLFGLSGFPYTRDAVKVPGTRFRIDFYATVCTPCHAGWCSPLISPVTPFCLEISISRDSSALSFVLPSSRRFRLFVYDFFEIVLDIVSINPQQQSIAPELPVRDFCLFSSAPPAHFHSHSLALPCQPASPPPQPRKTISSLLRLPLAPPSPLLQSYSHPSRPAPASGPLPP